MLMMHIANQPAPPRTLNPEIPDALEAAILLSLAKDPNQRFASMADFQEALRPANRPSAESGPVRATITRIPRQLPEQEPDAAADSPAAKAKTTFSETMGQLLPGKRTQRVRPGARRAVAVGGALLAAALVVYAAVAYRGRQTAKPLAEEPNAPVHAAASVLHPTAPLLPSAAPPDATLAVPTAKPPDDTAPSHAAVQATKLATNDSQPSGKHTGAKAKKGEKRNLAVAVPAPPPLPKESVQPKPPPVTPTPKGPKSAERW
jgi:hypothetical protein